MATLDRNSSTAEVEAAYDDNCSYQEDMSVAKCRAFITACRILINRRPIETARGNSMSVKWGEESLRKEIEAAQNWLASQPATSASSVVSVAHPDFSDFRG